MSYFTAASPSPSPPQLVSPVAASSDPAVAAALTGKHRQVYPYAHGDPLERFAEIRVFGEHGGVNKSVEASTTFTVLESSRMPEIFAGQAPMPVANPDEAKSGEAEGCYLYSRHFNPTVLALSHELAALEATPAAYCCASGMAAISSTLLQLCSAGGHIVSSDTVYGGTYALLHDFFPKRFNITTTFVDITDLAAVRAAFREKETSVLYFEVVSNPTLHVADVRALADIAHELGAQAVVDNTFSVLSVTPYELGADVVVHSLTKFINGASDIVSGAICGTAEFIGGLLDLHEGALMLLGPTMDPMTAFTISLRLPHLGLRIKEHSARAREFARQLAEWGLDVEYPGLKSHKGHEVMKKQMNAEFGYGGVLTLDCGTRERAFKLMDALQKKGFGYNAVSLGYFDTLMSCSASSTSSELSSEDLKKAGIKEGLVRVSVGYTGSLAQRMKQMEDVLRELGFFQQHGDGGGKK